MPVVRNRDQRAFEPDQEILEPVNRIEIEIVRGLVEQQRLRITEERLGKQHPNLLAALQLAHLALVQLVGNVEALEQHGGVALSRIAVFLADDALKLAQAHAVIVGELGLGVDGVAFFESRPQCPCYP